jgi:hypothetical protein
VHLRYKHPLHSYILTQPPTATLKKGIPFMQKRFKCIITAKYVQEIVRNATRALVAGFKYSTSWKYIDFLEAEIV